MKPIQIFIFHSTKIVNVYVFIPKYWSIMRVKVKKDEVPSKTGHKDPERESWYNSTLSLTWALDGGWRSKPRPGRFTPRKKDPVPIVQEAGWAPGPVWMSARNLASHRDSIPGMSSPQRVLSTLSRREQNILQTAVSRISRPRHALR